MKIIPALILILSIAFISYVGTVFIIDHLNTKSNKTSNTITEKVITKALEQAYFEGQKDYMNGDIRIEILRTDTIDTYQWIKSPWDNNELPLFNPKLIPVE